MAHNRRGGVPRHDLAQPLAKRATLILASSATRTCAVFAALALIAARVIAVPVQNPRSSQPAEVAAHPRKLPELRCTIAGDLGRRCAKSRSASALVCGRLFLVGERSPISAQQWRPEVSAQ
jgi:hypothetical protein